MKQIVLHIFLILISSYVYSQVQTGTVKVKKQNCTDLRLWIFGRKDTITLSEARKSVCFTAHVTGTCHRDQKHYIKYLQVLYNNEEFTYTQGTCRPFMSPGNLTVVSAKVHIIRTNPADTIVVYTPQANFYIIDDTPTVSEPSYDPSNVKLTLAGLSEGEISKKRLIEDPVLRLSNNPNNSFSLKSYTVSTKINGKSSQNYYQGDSLFPQQEIKVLGSVKKKKSGEGILFIQNVILRDLKGREHKISSVAFKIIPD
jgi:hypothetical protein